MRRAHRLALSAAALLVAARVGSDAVGAVLAWRAAYANREVAIEIGFGAGGTDRAVAGPGAAIAGGAAPPPGGSVASAHAGEPEAPRARRRTSASVDPIVLDDVPATLGAAVTLDGVDPYAPRRLALHRIAGERAVRVALGASEPDGSLAFAPIVLPAGAVTLVVAPRGADPFDDGASQPIVVRRDPTMPRVAFEVRARDAGRAAAFAVEPAEAGGFVVVTATRLGVATELARVAVPEDAEQARARIAIEVPLAFPDSTLALAHEIPDGRRSPAVVVPFVSNVAEERTDAEIDAALVP